jgi:signal transduction histidine kinase
MVVTIAACSPLLLLLAVPGYIADHHGAPMSLVVVAWCLAAGMIVAVLISLARLGARERLWLRVSVGCFVALLALESFTLHRPLPPGSSPWLWGLSYVAVACVAVAEVKPVRAGLTCAGLTLAVAAFYARDVPLGQSAINAAGLAVASGVFIVSIWLRRIQADRVDTAEQHAQALYAQQHRDLVVEAERVRTDAFLHDSVLATLSAAASQRDPRSAARMARTTLEVLTDSRHRSGPRPLHIPFRRAVADAERQFAPLRHQVDIDFTAIDSVELPPDVADALVTATLQAIENSITHAGSGAHRAVTTERTARGGVRITVTDDGRGFDPEGVAQERLGVRLSIVERMENVGGNADVLSSPGNGTTVGLSWSPIGASPGDDRQSFGMQIELIPRRRLYRILGAFIVVAILAAIAEAALVSRAVGPVIAAVLGLMLLPGLIRGARTGTMRNRTAWGMAAVGLVLCCTATIGLDPDVLNAVTISWYTCGMLAGCVMVWMAGHRAPPLVVVVALAAQITLWAGPTGAIRLGFAGEIVLIVAGVMMYRTLTAVTTAADAAAVRHRRIAAWQNERHAFDRQRQQRLGRVTATAGPMLRHIIDHDGLLTATAQRECRVLEQALRDEIRGRHLLNDAMRNVIAMHRRRGAEVQVLDDGGLDTIDQATLDDVLDDAASRLEPVQASRIVIRTGRPDSDTVITLVATTPNGTATALGLDNDDDVELWETIRRPARATRTA